MEYYIVFEYDEYDNVSVFETLFQSYEHALEFVRETVYKGYCGYMEPDALERKEKAYTPNGADVGDIGGNEKRYFIRRVKTDSSV